MGDTQDPENKVYQASFLCS